jgi:uncharacterized protein
MRHSDPMTNRIWYADVVFWGVLLAGVALAALWSRTFGGGERPDVAALILLILVYPILEEVVFRGMIQPALHRRIRHPGFGPLSVANIVTSVIFAIAHLPAHGVLQSALVFGPSLLFGLFRDRHGTVASAAVLHVSWNAASVLILGLGVTPF